MKNILLLFFKPFFVLFLGLLSGLSLITAQEICNNALDDDGDSFIDLNDEDCVCNEVTVNLPSSFIPNASFEDYNCIPDFYSLMECAEGWIQASEATSDYFHVDGYFPDNFEIPFAPTPIPDGDAFVGFFNAFYGGIVYKEYVGSCTDEELIPGTSYTIAIDIGFSGSTSEFFSASSNAPLEICVYGNESCDNLPFDVNLLTGNYACPLDENQDEWVLLDCITVSGFDEWVSTTLSFDPPNNINAIVLGPSCEPVSNSNDLYYYYFLDNLVLNQTQAFESVPVEVINNCDGFEIAIESQGDYDVQWYKEGIAIIGANSLNYDAELSDTGLFQIWFTSGTECFITEIVLEPAILPEIQIIADTVLCVGTSLELLVDYDGQLTWAADASLSCTNCPNPIVTPTQTTTYTVINEFNCETEITIYVDEPIPVEIVGQPVVALGQGTMLNATGGTEYTWDPDPSLSCLDCPNPIASPTETTTYTVTSNNMCESTQTFTLIVTHNFMEVPTAFSPNGDLVNDLLVPQANGTTQYEMIIFNRYGNLLFQTNDPTIGWDGTYKGELQPIDVYVYCVEYMFNQESEMRKKQGNFTLLR